MLIDSQYGMSCNHAIDMQRNILSEAWCMGKYCILLVMFVYDNPWYFLFFVIDLVYGLSLIACGLHFHCVLNPGCLHPWECSVCMHPTYSWFMDWGNLSTRKPLPKGE